jgi:hypothetical protein
VINYSQAISYDDWLKEKEQESFARMPPADPEHIILFRGDREFIHRFKYERTDAGALYGRGIYLTDDITVAATYRTKTDKLFGKIGDHKKEAEAQILFSGLAESSADAINQACANLRYRIDPYGNILLKPWRRRITRKHSEVIAKRIAEIAPKLSVQSDIMQGGMRISKFWTEEVKYTDYPAQVKVRFTSSEIPFIGRITIFKFPREEIFTRTISEELIAFKGAGLQRIVPDAIKQDYIGLRYVGGKVMGDHEHTCFVIWNTDYVNFHRIRSIR